MGNLEQRTDSEIPNSENFIRTLVYNSIIENDSEIESMSDLCGSKFVLPFIELISTIEVVGEYLVSGRIPGFGMQFHAYDFSARNGLLPVKVSYMMHKRGVQRNKNQRITDRRSFGNVYWFAVEEK